MAMPSGLTSTPPPGPMEMPPEPLTLSPMEMPPASTPTPTTPPGKRGAVSGWLCVKGSSQPTRQDAGVRCSARLVSLTARVDVDAVARADAAQVGHRTTRPRRRYRSAAGRHLAVARHWRVQTDPRGANLYGSKLAFQHPPCLAPPAQSAQGWRPRPPVRGPSAPNALRADAAARLGWDARLGQGARLGWGKPEPVGPQCARLRWLWRLRWSTPQGRGLPDRQGCSLRLC